MKLNEHQNKIVHFCDANLIVSASPGSGKTTTIVERAKRIIKTKKTNEKLALITYTNAAADEIISRLSRVENIFIGTIHAFCLEYILKPFGWLLKLKPCKIISYDQRKDFFELNTDIVLNKGWGQNRFKELGKIRHNLDGTICTDVEWEHEVSIELVVERYKYFLIINGLIDFEDILINSHRLVNEYDFIGKSLSGLFKEIMVDEFQDTDHFQYEILKHIHDSGNCAFTFVGDEKQRIFGFAGAIDDAFDRAEIDFQAVPFSLSDVYRSTDSIVNCYCKIFEVHPVIDNKASVKDANHRSIQYLVTKKANYRNMLLTTIRGLLEEGYDLNEIAVLSTSWFASFETSKALREEFKVCGQGALPHPSVGDSTYQIFRSIVKFINRPSNSRMRVIRRNFDLFCLENGIIFDDKNCSKIINSLILGITNIDDEDSIPVSFDKLSKLFESTFEIACSSFMEVIELIKEEEVEFWNFSKYCGAVSNDSGIRNDTIHKVKGLEFDVVILNGINENKLPRQKLLDASNWTYKDLTEDDINKARTVFYVACSRPRKKLIINHNWKPSMFIDLIKQ